MAKHAMQEDGKAVDTKEGHTPASAPEVTVTDPSGRAIRLKAPGVLAHYKLVEALGESARNQMYVAMVIPLLYVNAIDSAPVRPPASKAEIEHLIERLGESGIGAVMQGMMQHFMVRTEHNGAFFPPGQLGGHGQGGH